MAMTWQDNLGQATSLMDFLLKGPARRVQERTSALTPLMRQLPTTVAAAIGPQITSNDPALQAQGQGLLAEYLRRNSPQARQELDNARLSGQSQRLTNTLNVIQSRQEQEAADRAAQLFPGQQEYQRLQIQGQRLQNQAATLQNQQLQDAIQNAPRPIPPGYIGPVIEQGNLANQAREGAGAARTLANIWEQAGTFDPMRNPEIKGTAVYAAMGTVPILQQMLNSGTLNEGEMEAFSGLIGDLQDPVSAWQRISKRDPAVITMLRSLADRADRNQQAIARSPVGPYIDPTSLTPMVPGWQPPPGTVPLEMPVTPEGQFQSRGSGVDPARGRNAVGDALARGIGALPGVLAEGFRNRGP